MEETDKPSEKNGGGDPHAPSSSKPQTPNSNPPPGKKQKKYTAYKLIVDPALVKGALKVYRFDGVIPADSSSYPSILLRDPRKQNRKPTEAINLPVPQFRVDSNYVGEIPPTEVTFTNLNNNVGEIYLQNLSAKFGFVEDVKIYHHPVSHRHLGFGHVVFKNSRDAKLCVDKLNATYVMGKKVNVCRDPNGKKCRELFYEETTFKLASATKADSKKGRSCTAPPSATKALATTPTKSSSRQTHLKESRHYKDDLTSTPYDGASKASASSDDRKSFVSKTGSRNRDRESGDVFNRFNINYERYEANNSTPGSSNYGYPIPCGSSQSSRTLTPSVSSIHTPLSNFHHQQVSLPSSPQVGTKVGVCSSPICSDSLVSNNNPDYDKVSDYGELSPKMDLDTRIKMLLEGRNSGEFGKLFSDVNNASSESDAEEPPKRVRLSLGRLASATIWNSESEGESREASFARKFKQSFVPVSDVNAPSSRGDLSPPPSPFLAFNSSSASKSVKGKPDPEFDQISDDEDGQLDKDDMSLSSLSPEANCSSRIKQDYSIPIPLPPNSVHSSYHEEYYNNKYPPNYHMPAWSGQQSQGHDVSPSVTQGHYAQSTNHGCDNLYNQGCNPQQTEPPQPEVTQEEQEDHKDPTLLIDSLIDYMVDDLKKVLMRDCHRRLIEAEAFKLFEDWWDTEERELKRKQDEEKAKSLPAPVEPAAVAPILIPDFDLGMGLGLGLGFRNIPKLPSFRRKRKIELPTPISDEDSRKSYLDSDDDDSSSASDKEELRGQRVLKKTKPIVILSSDEESEVSTSTTNSSLSEGEEVEASDAETISTTEDEDGLSDSNLKPETESKVPPKSKIDIEDILSADDGGVVPDEEKESLVTFSLCDRTGRMITKSQAEESIQVQQDVPSPTPNPATVSEKQEVEEKMSEGVLDYLKSDRALAVSLDAKLNARSSRFDAGAGYRNTPEYNDEKPIIIPYDAIRPRGESKCKNLGFRPRIDDEILDVIYEFLRDGIDAEDIQYFKQAHELLLSDDSLYWLYSMHWIDHPQTLIKKKLPTSLVKKEGWKKKNVVPDTEDGSLRTRGFMRMTKEEKMLLVDGKQLSVALALGGDKGRSRETKIREARSDQRRLLTALGAESDLFKFNQLQFRKKALRFARSGIHEWGLFAAEPIAADDMVIEYVGQVIRPIVADLRETKYEARGIGSSYLFRIDQETIIDATKCGSLSRFINHSCNPNCYAKVITIEGKKKIVIYSKQPIAVSEEITYDYKFPLEDKKIPCLCGTTGCRGTLN